MRSFFGLQLSLALLIGGSCAAFANRSPAADVSAQAARQVAQRPKKERAQKKAGAHQDVVLPAPRRTPADDLKLVNLKALRMAIEDLMATFGVRYLNGVQYLTQLKTLEQQKQELEAAVEQRTKGVDSKLSSLVAAYRHLRQEVLLSNPLINFDRLLLVQRGQAKLGLPQNWQGNCALPKVGYDNAIMVLAPLRPDGKLTTLYKPGGTEFVGDLNLNFDADKLLFSMPKAPGRWQIWEIKTDGSGLRQVTPGEEPDVDNYNACYLPNGRILFDSTRCFQGVPCVGGGNTVANLFLMEADGSRTRQVCFDQDHDWYPSLLNDGRVLYTRWEYTDTPHYFTRLLFHMNPDGTNQSEYYKSNSLWPNSTFYAKAIPGHPTKVVGVISGHHGAARMGELVIFDPAKGRRQAEGAVQRIPGFGVKVEPVIGDQIVGKSWPKFLHPQPLSEKYFLVAMKPDPYSLWGIYLVDIFDNLTLIKELPGYALFEPVPLRKTPRPPIIPDRVNPESREATVYLSNIYAGKGLEDVPPGTVKRLRIFEPHYAYPAMGGHISIGIDGPWDVHRILGTVPVEADGSANFKVPANTPIAVQPLDEKGRAIQIMRSWFTAMPGETVSCVGCHDSQNTTPGRWASTAVLRKPSEITPWYGPARGFSFKREIQPVLYKYCIGCHDGSKTAGGPPRPDFRCQQTDLPLRKGSFNFTSSYAALHPYVRRPGPESDYFLQKPMEYHAGTSELVQLLEKGHYHVKLDAEAWDHLNTWIDLNVPDHGTWSEHRPIAKDYHDRRLAMRTKYANRPEDPEKYPMPAAERPAFVKPEPRTTVNPQELQVPGWPFDAAEARLRQAAAAKVLLGGEQPQALLDPGDGLHSDLALIPAGTFIMGDAHGCADETPLSAVTIEKPFWMGRFEVTNAQFAQFDPLHDSAYISYYNKDQSSRGLAVNRPTQPVVRVSWQHAMEYCHWLSHKTGRKFTLPTESQWEYAGRAGSDTPLYYGGCATDFSKLANLADLQLLSLCRRDSPKWIPAVKTVNDGAVVTESVGRYPANAWGLCDMAGNAAEWTRSAYRPYPYDRADGRDDPGAKGTKVVRGGSFYDRPERARSGFRLHYPPWQRVYNVGFRVVMETE